MSDDYLAHHGIVGMKWGVRRYQNKDRTLTPEGKLRYKKTPDKKTPDKKTSSPSSKKTSTKSRLKSAGKDKPKEELSSISDDELRRRINRLNLEKQYKDLTRTQKKAKSRGMKLVEDMIYDATKNIGTQVLTYSMGKAVNKVFKGEIVNLKGSPKKKKDKDDD